MTASFLREVEKNNRISLEIQMRVFIFRSANEIMAKQKGRPPVKDKRIRVSFMAYASTYEKAIKAMGKEYVDKVLESRLIALARL